MSFFNGKAVIVTGSSNGIGRATARMLAGKGAKVTIHGRNPETIKVTKEQCLAAGAKEEDILIVLGEIEKDETRLSLVNETVDKFGGIDVLVNNAGLIRTAADGRVGLDAPVEILDAIMEINLRAVLQLVQLAVPHLEKTKGAIVNVSSIASMPFTTKDFYYSLSKAALDELTVNLGGNLILKDIRVNSVNPGGVETDFMRKYMPEDVVEKIYTEKWNNNRTAIPLGRVSVPDDIAKVILFLADRSQSEVIVGQRIVADGGSTLQNVILSTNMPSNH